MDPYNMWEIRLQSVQHAIDIPAINPENQSLASLVAFIVVSYIGSA